MRRRCGRQVVRPCATYSCLLTRALLLFGIEFYPASARRGKREDSYVPAQCQACGKRTAFGRNIRHKSSGRWQRKAHRTGRQFRPNLQRQAVWRDGKRVKLRICTRCLRTTMKVAG
ncbi:MAG: bL28 family ribosomal protein [Dehalococcoidia bacterium]